MKKLFKTEVFYLIAMFWVFALIDVKAQEPPIDLIQQAVQERFVAANQSEYNFVYDSGNVLSAMEEIRTVVVGLAYQYYMIDSLDGVKALPKSVGEIRQGEISQIPYLTTHERFNLALQLMCDMKSTIKHPSAWKEYYSFLNDDWFAHADSCQEAFEDTLANGAIDYFPTLPFSGFSFYSSYWGYEIESYEGIYFDAHFEISSSKLAFDLQFPISIKGSAKNYLKFSCSEEYDGPLQEGIPVPIDSRYHEFTGAKLGSEWVSPQIGAQISGPAICNGGVDVRMEDSLVLIVPEFSDEYKSYPGIKGCAYECTSCSGGSCDVASLDSLNITFGLGTAHYGHDAGQLQVRTERLADDYISVNSFRALNVNDFEVRAHASSGSLKREYIGDSMYTAMHETTDGNGFPIVHLKQYELGTVDCSTPGVPCSVSGDPIKELIIQPCDYNPDPAVKEIEATFIQDGIQDRAFVYEYSEAMDGASNQWVLKSGANTPAGPFLRHEMLQVTQTPTGKTEHRCVTDSDNNVISDSGVSTIVNYPWGKETVSLVESPGNGPNRTQTWEYYDDAVNDGSSYGKLKKRTAANGAVTLYEYDMLGRESKRIEPFKDANPGTAPENQCKVTETSYESNANFETISTRVVKIQGQEVERVYTQTGFGKTTVYRCLEPGLSFADASDGLDDDALISETHYMTSGVRLGSASMVLNPDGTRSETEYDEVMLPGGKPGLEITRTQYVPASSGHEAIQRTIQTLNAAGATIKSETFALASEYYGLASDLKIGGFEVTQLSVFNVPEVTVHFDGTSEQQATGCCGVSKSSTDRMGVTTTYIQDALNRTVEETRADITTKRDYDADGNLLKVTRIGRDNSEMVRATYGYNLLGERTWSKDAMNYEAVYSFDSNNLNRQKTEYPDGGVSIEVAYLDGSRKATEGTASHPSAFDYGAEANQRFTKTIIGSTSLSGTEWTKSYTDMGGRQVKTVYPDDAEETNHYNNIGQLIKSVDADGVVNLYAYDAAGQRTVQAIDMDRDDVIDYNGADRITEMKQDYYALSGNVYQRVRSYDYRTDANAAKTLVSTSEKVLNGQSQREIRFGVETSSSVVLLGNQMYRIFSKTSSANEPGVLNYQDIGPDGVVSEIVSPSVSNVTYEYDAHGRKSAEIDARNGRTDYHYRADDRLFGMVMPSAGAGHPRLAREFGYDALGRPNVERLSDGSYTYTEYNLRGEQTKKHGSQTYFQEYTYDNAGRVKTLTTDQDTDAPGGEAVTTWNYHAQRGWLTSKVYDDSKGTQYTYSDAGRLHTRAWHRGVTTTYAYDNGGTLSGVDYSDATPDVTIVSDRLGRQRTVTDGVGARNLTYANNNLSGETPTSGFILGHSVSHVYDTSNRPYQVHYGGYITRYHYDAASRITTAEDGTLVGGYNMRGSYAYVPNLNRIASLIYTLPGSSLAMASSKSYDKLGQVTDVKMTGLPSQVASLRYAYNALGQRTNIQSGDGFYWDYEYDGLGQVTSGVKKLPDGEPLNGYEFGYGFDDIGNRTQTVTNGRTDTYTANTLNQYTQRTFSGAIDVVGKADPLADVTVNTVAATRQGNFFHGELPVTNTSAPVYPEIEVKAENSASVEVTAEGRKYVPKTPESFTYDDDGNLLSDGRWNYTWNGENRLIAMEAITAAPAEAKLKLEFAYDWQGRRIKKTVAPWNAGTSSYDAPTTTTKFVYDGWNLVAEVVNGVIERRYIWGPDLSGSLQGAGGVGGLVAMLPTGHNWQIAHSDANGNVTMLVDAKTGEVTAEYEYGPFGEVVRSTGDLADENPFRFSTKYEEVESGLLYYGYRFYDAGVGRWVNRDPILDAAFTVELPQSARFNDNFLEYVYNINNAGNLTDYLGLTDQCDKCGPEMGRYFDSALKMAALKYDQLSYLSKWKNCQAIRWMGKWDLGRDYLTETIPLTCSTGKCKGTANVYGKCHDYSVVNYALLGVMGRKCNLRIDILFHLAFLHKAFIRPLQGGSGMEFDGTLVNFIWAGYYDQSVDSVPEPEKYVDCAFCPEKYKPTNFWSESTWPYRED